MRAFVEMEVEAGLCVEKLRACWAFVPGDTVEGVCWE